MLNFVGLLLSLKFKRVGGVPTFGSYLFAIRHIEVLDLCVSTSL